MNKKPVLVDARKEFREFLRFSTGASRDRADELFRVLPDSGLLGSDAGVKEKVTSKRAREKIRKMVAGELDLTKTGEPVGSAGQKELELSPRVKVVFDGNKTPVDLMKKLFKPGAWVLEPTNDGIEVYRKDTPGAWTEFFYTIGLLVRNRDVPIKILRPQCHYLPQKYVSIALEDGDVIWDPGNHAGWQIRRLTDGSWEFFPFTAK